MVKIMNRLQAINYSYLKNNPNAIIISISTPNDNFPSFYLKSDSVIRDVFYIKMNDIEEDIYINGRLRYKAPTLEDLNGLKEFVDKYKNSTIDIIVHCDAGISRSSAVAIVICRYLGLNDDWIWNDFNYHPNKLVLKLALEEFKINITLDDLEELIRLNENLKEDSL